LEEDKFTDAIKALKPVRKRGPWFVLSDNESFLKTDGARKYYRKAGITLWFIPPRSPDLNPIEKFWSWLRRELTRRDLQDLKNGNRVLAKPEYTKRVQAVLRTRKAQEVAANCVRGFRKTCQKISDSQGAAVKG
jgi:transposase